MTVRISPNDPPPTTDLFEAALKKGKERYVVLWDGHNRFAAAEAVVRWALDPELSMTIRDAKTLLVAMDSRSVK